MISPELIELFNKAARLAREGKLEESLAEFDSILSPSKERIDENKQKKMVMSGEFLGVTMMRKSWVLMDLKRYKEAKTVLDDQIMQACLGQFDMSTLYEYFFSFGNVLGELKDIKGMDDKFTRALNIAAKELGDKNKCFQCWSNLLTYAFKAEDWKYLEVESATAREYADSVGDPVLRVKAGWHHIVALMNLERFLEAMEESDVMMTYLRQVGADEALDEIEELVAQMKARSTKEKVTKGRNLKKKPTTKTKMGKTSNRRKKR